VSCLLSCSAGLIPICRDDCSVRSCASYLRTGAYPGGAEPVGKISAALPDDTVEIEPRWVAINRVRLAHSAITGHDSSARPLPHVAWGKRPVAANEVWLFGFNDRRSWDARYFGPISLWERPREAGASPHLVNNMSNPP